LADVTPWVSGDAPVAMVAQQVGVVFGKGGSQFSAHAPFLISFWMFGSNPIPAYFSTSSGMAPSSPMIRQLVGEVMVAVAL